MNQETKKDILLQAIDKIKAATGMKFSLSHNKKGQEDYYLRVAQGLHHTSLPITVYGRLTKNTAADIAARLKPDAQKSVLITTHVSAPLADYLKNLDQPFIDTAGNAYINTPPLFIFIQGNKPIAKSLPPQPSRAFGSTGLKIIYALLCNPDLINMTYRDMARKACCALGSVNVVVNDLQRLGYLLDNKIQGRLLTQKEELLRRWIIAYAEQLRPKLFIERYGSKDYNWWQNVDMAKYGLLWGGEVAAARLSNDYLKPQDLTIYANELPHRMIIENRLFKDKHGNIEIIKSFWEQDAGFFRQGDLVHPILVYADLISTGDQRNIEVAGMIHERHIAGLIGKD